MSTPTAHTHWTTDQDFLVCNILLEHGLEHVELGLEWVRELFLPLPLELFGRTHSEIASRIKTLQAILLSFLKSRKRFSGAELVKWLRRDGSSCSSLEAEVSIEGDFEGCNEAGACTPLNSRWAAIAILSRSGTTVHGLRQEVEAPVTKDRSLSRNKRRNDQSVLRPFTVSVTSAFEPPMKKQSCNL